MNWGNLCLQVTLERAKVKIQGDPTLSKSQVSLHSLVHTLKRERQDILLELQSAIPGAQLEPDSVPTYPLSPSVIRLLQDFQDIFETPTGLPPPRTKDHSITLHPGTSPISVRPYRYPQIQKTEIEHLVTRMLQAGII